MIKELLRITYEYSGCIKNESIPERTFEITIEYKSMYDRDRAFADALVKLDLVADIDIISVQTIYSGRSI